MENRAEIMKETKTLALNGQEMELKCVKVVGINLRACRKHFNAIWSEK